MSEPLIDPVYGHGRYDDAELLPAVTNMSKIKYMH